MAQKIRKQTAVKPKAFSLQKLFDKTSWIILLFFVLLPIVYIPIYYASGDVWLNYSSIFTYAGGIAALLTVLTYGIARFTANSREFKQSFKAKPWLIALLIAVLWAFISCLLAEDVSTAFWGHDHRRDGFFLLLCYWGVMGAALILKNQQYKNILLRVLVLAAVPVCLVMLAQYFEAAYTTITSGDTVRILKNTNSSVFLNSNHLGYYQAIVLAAAGGLFCWDCCRKPASAKSRLIWAISWLILLAFFTWCLIINNTFGAYLAVIIGLAFVAVIFTIRASQVKPVKRIIFWLPLIICLLTTFVIVFGFSSTQMSKSFLDNKGFFSLDLTESQTSEDVTNTYSRMRLWNLTWDMIKKEPVLGYGADSISSVFMAAEFNESGQDRPHNEYLQYGVYYGLPFLILLLFGLLTLGVQQLIRLIRYKNVNYETLIALGAFLTYWAVAFTGVAIFYTAVYSFMLLGLIAALPDKTGN